MTGFVWQHLAQRSSCHVCSFSICIFSARPLQPAAACNGAATATSSACNVHGGNAGLAVSVLIPGQNEALRIGPLIDSVLSGAGIHCEVCVLDDESHDGTDAIVLNYSRDRQRAADTRNTGSCRLERQAVCLLATDSPRIVSGTCVSGCRCDTCS